MVVYLIRRFIYLVVLLKSKYTNKWILNSESFTSIKHHHFKIIFNLVISYCKCDRLWVQFPLEEVKYLIFCILRSGVEVTAGR